MFRAAIFGARLGSRSLVIEAMASCGPHHEGIVGRMWGVLQGSAIGFCRAELQGAWPHATAEHITPELKPRRSCWDSLAAADRYRQRFPSAPASLTNAVLMARCSIRLGS